MPFVKGQSGNPAGRPIGHRNRQTLALEALLEAEGPELLQKLLEQARGARPWAMRLRGMVSLVSMLGPPGR